MAWAKLDDGYPTHPKVIQAGEKGLALDIAGMAYAAKHLTDGFIADGVLSGLYPPLKQPRKVAELLSEVGRWKRDDQRKGWWIHDYLECNFSAEATAQKRKVDRERATRAAEARWANSKGRTNSDSAREDASEHARRNAASNGSGNGSRDASSRPVPSQETYPLTPTPGGVGGLGNSLRRGSRAIGDSPRQRAAKDTERRRERARLDEAAAFGRKYAGVDGVDEQRLVDRLASQDLSADESRAAVSAFRAEIAEARAIDTEREVSS